LNWGTARAAQLFDADPFLVLAVLTLAGLGELNLLAIGEADLALHQALALLIGFGLMAFCFQARPRTRPWLGRAVYLGAVGMLMAVSAMGVSAYGAQRWLTFGSLVLQPSELAKLGLLLVLADVLGVRAGTRPRLVRVLLAFGLAAVPVVLTLMQPDLSTTALLGVVLLATLLLARVPFRLIGGAVVVGLFCAPFALRFMRPYQLARLNSFLHGTHDYQGAGWSTLQAHVAIASGGFYGIVRAPIHQLLALYLPARQTDLAFASLVEQWGLVAGGLALLAVVVLVWRLVATARLAAAPDASLMAGALAALLSAEVAISVAGNIGSAPLAGVPFPLLSYGGTAATAHLAALGLVLGVRRHARERRLWRVGMPALPPRMVRLLGLGMAGLMLGLGGLTYQVQLAQSAALGSFGVAQMTRCTRLPAPRGVIEDRHGVPLAVNDPTAQVFVVPALIEGEPGYLSRLTTLAGLGPEALKAIRGAPPQTLALNVAQVPAEVGARVAEANLPGVQVVATQKRHYPYGPLLGPVLGWVGVLTAEDSSHRYLALDAYVGRAGLERQYDWILRGRDGYQCLLVDPKGVPVTVSDVVAPLPGTTLRLSLDLQLQQQATAVLADAMRKNPYHPDQGALVVMDARGGQLLALASVPAYDDNLYGPPIDLAALRAASRAPGDPMLEHATQTAMPPGSTFKLVVAAADTVYNAIPPAQVIPTGYTFALGTSVFHGWGPLPPQNLTQAIAWSNDVYFYKLALALGPERMAGVAKELGVGEPTGIDLPGETPGLLGTPESMSAVGVTWYPGSTVIMGIGQGYVTATPLQNARWTAAVAAGKLVTPRLALAERPAGQDSYYLVPGARAPVPLSFAAKLGPVRDGLRLAVTQGTGTMLRDLPIAAGGKTGTAEDPSAPTHQADAWFTSVAPVNDPQVVITMVVRGGGEGHQVSEPAVRQLWGWYLAHRAQVDATTAALPADVLERLPN
jgi:cell division protein FtsI/penicillin-binding protein 2/cell division protein FtsW (lipid II flippase)